MDKANQGIVYLIRNSRGLETQLDDALQEVSQAVNVHEGAGEITLKLKFKPEGGGQVTLIPAISCKTPRPSPSSAIFFGDPRGRLFRSDPNQRDLVFDTLVGTASDPTTTKGGGAKDDVN